MQFGGGNCIRQLEGIFQNIAELEKDNDALIIGR